MSADLEAPELRRDAPLDRLLVALTVPFDALRRPLWRASALTAFGRSCIRDRGLRLTTLAVLHILVAFALTAVLPLWMLLVGPLLLGVPHIVGDIRYLVLRSPVPLVRPGLALILAPLVLMTLHRVAPFFGLPFSSGLEVALATLAVAAAVACARAPLTRRVASLGLIAVLGGYLAASPERAHDAVLGMAHLHNLIALGLWLFAMRGEVRAVHVAAVLVTYGGVAAVFLSGSLDPMLAAAAPIGSFDLTAMSATLAPGLPHETALRWVGLYAFAQAFHYAIWIRLIPQRLDDRPAPPTFRRSLGRLRAELGRGFIVVALVSVGLPLLAVLAEPADVRHAYLIAAIGHGWLEVAIIAALLTRGRGDA